MLKTRVFELSGQRYSDLSELAHAMGISVSQVYRVRSNKRGINEKFIIGAKRAFPEYGLDDLFYLAPDIDLAKDRRYQRVVPSMFAVSQRDRGI